MTESAKPHTTHRFDEALEMHTKQCLRHGELAKQQLDDAMTALIEGDDALVESVIDNDDRLDNMKSDINGACILPIMRQTLHVRFAICHERHQ